MKKLILSLIPLAWAAVACNTVSIEEPARYGQLSVALADEPVIEVQTKSGTALDKGTDAAKEYDVSVFNSSDEKQGETVTFYDFETQTLPFGTYYVTAENCTEEEAEVGNGKMRLAGRSEDVALSLENLSGTASVECAVTNAKVAVEFDSSVSEKFTDLKVKLTGGTTTDRQDKGITIEESREVIETWFNPSTLSYTISATGVQAVTGTKDLDAKDNIKILVKVNQQTGTLTVSAVSVDESINEGGQITGSFNPYL